MNKHQKQVLILCAGILLAMLLFPPFQVQVRGTAFNMGYHYLAEPPRRGSIPASVNVQMLLAQWVGVALLGAVAVLLLKEPPDGGNATRGPATSAQPPLSPPAPPPVDQSRTFLGGQHHPWRRFFARMIDSTIFGSLMVEVFAVLLPETAAKLTADSGAWIFLPIVALPPMIPVEAVLISNFKTTPGKWLFGVRVTDGYGAALSFRDAVDRSFRIWVQGAAMGIPFVWVIPVLFAYRRLTRTGTTLWDTSCHAVVTHQRWTPGRAAGAVVSVLALFVGIPAINQGSRMPSQAVSETDYQGVRAELPTGTTDDYSPRHFTGEERLLLGRPGRSVVTFEEASSDRFRVRGDAIDAYKRGDFAAALDQLVAVANQGDAVAEFYVGEMLLNGNGIAKDAATAFQWYLSAANRGYMSAATTVGILYLKGVGVRQDIATGAEWLRRAADAQLGDGIAEYNLGILSEAGLFGDPDFGNAYAWYQNSAAEARSDDVRALAVQSMNRLRSKVDINQAGHGISSKQPTIERGTYKKDQVARPCVFKGVMTNADYRACGLTPP